MSRNDPRRPDIHALFAGREAKRAEFAQRVGQVLSDLGREAEGLNLPLLAHLLTMAQVEADAIRGESTPVNIRGVP